MMRLLLAVLLFVSTTALAQSEIGTAPAPAPPEDHAADAIFVTKEMAKARETLRYENGGMVLFKVGFDLAEYQFRTGKGGYRWEGEAWIGGDIDRFKLKYEGEGEIRGGVEEAEFQALYERAISPYWNLQGGVRHDLKPSPSRTYAVLGVEGLAPYWIELAATVFLSTKGDILARAEGHYDHRITQSLILQPRLEANISAQNIPEIDVGAGLSTFEVGLRLRYEISRQFAPYMGVEWNTKAGDTASFARAAGEKPSTVNFVIGVKAWF
jgi:copper resistance protein B